MSERKFAVVKLGRNDTVKVGDTVVLVEWIGDYKIRLRIESAFEIVRIPRPKTQFFGNGTPGGPSKSP